MHQSTQEHILVDYLRYTELKIGSVVFPPVPEKLYWLAFGFEKQK